jgi:peptidoglycan/xylan/chitin deacetylase (PgdA/CDA1 family)
MPAHAARKSRHRPAPGFEIAVTFDDLPVHGDLPRGVSRADVINQIIHALKAHHVPPTYGFVNAHWIAEDPKNAEVLRLWRAAGNPLGNHSYTHMDANKNTAMAFEQDVIDDEPTLRKYMTGADWHWLRLPYLDIGDTVQKSQAITEALVARKYRLAQVALSFEDYAYNDAYARCRAKGDKGAVAWMTDSYLDRASVDLLTAQTMSKQLYGRDIKYVLLMHIGAFDAVMVPRLLNMYRQRGAKLISLSDAENDPAYRQVGGPQSGWGGGAVLSKQMTAKNIPLPSFANTESILNTLASLCK